MECFGLFSSPRRAGIFLLSLISHRPWSVFEPSENYENNKHDRRTRSIITDVHSNSIIQIMSCPVSMCTLDHNRCTFRFNRTNHVVSYIDWSCPSSLMVFKQYKRASHNIHNNEWHNFKLTLFE